MILTAIRTRGAIMAALMLTVFGVVGCNSDSGGTPALPPSSALPEPPKEAIGPDGKPKHSAAAFDSARGGKAP